MEHASTSVAQLDTANLSPCGTAADDDVSRIVGQPLILSGVAYPPLREGRSHEVSDPAGDHRTYRDTERQPLGWNGVCFVDDTRTRDGTAPRSSNGTIPGFNPDAISAFDFFAYYLTAAEWSDWYARATDGSTSAVKPAIPCDEAVNGYQPTALCAYVKPFGDHVLALVFRIVEPSGKATPEQRSDFVAAVLGGMP